jgi:hypothetical protein
MTKEQCPNIKQEILTFKTKLGELELLKLKFLRDNDSYDKYTLLNQEINQIKTSINTKIDDLANVAIKPKIEALGIFSYVGSYSEGRARAKDKQGKQFHIDLNGKPVYPERYKFAGSYSEGRARVVDKVGSQFHVDRNGKELYSQRYVLVDSFYEGKALVQDKDGNIFRIDQNGKRIDV